MIVAKILKPQGIRGELKLEPLTSDINLFLDFKNVFIDKKLYTIKSVRIHESFVYVVFNEICDRNFAETLRGKMVEVERSSLPKLEEDFYYIQDLVGCFVFFDDNEKLGKIVDVQNFGASDILVIKDGSEEILCPFLKKVFKDVDLENKKIVADKESFLEVTKSED